jgi:hypothetical protein
MTYLGRLKSIANDIKELLEAEDDKKDEPKIRCYRETER